MPSRFRFSRLSFVFVAAVATVLVITAFLVAKHDQQPRESAAHQSEADDADHDADHDADSDGDGDGDAGEMQESLEQHPGLASHRLPLAFVAEKLAQQGGEASGEILNGPSQENYDQRSYPRAYITPQRQHVAAAAFARTRQRANTSDGRQALQRALGAAKSSSWTSIGPDGGLQVPESTYTGTPAIVSGRVTSLATAKTCSKTKCVLIAGTAGGGVWKTVNALADTPHWVAIGADIPSTSIGVVYRGPNGNIYVGTGEPNGSSDSEAGVGLYKSSDEGRNFTKVPTFVNTVDFALNRSVSSIAIDPANPKHMYVGTAVARHGSSSVNGGRFTPPGSVKVGVFETHNAGQTWHRSLTEDSDAVDPSSPNGSDFFRGGISKLAFDPTHPGTVYAAMFDYGLFRRTGSGPWQQIYTISTPGDPATGLDSRVEFALATLPNGNTRIYLGDATYYDESVAGFLRSDNGTARTPAWTELSDATEGTPGYGSYNFCEGQCSYDMLVSSPPNRPDQVYLSGSMNYDELQAFGGPGDSNGRAVIRSTDAGVDFTDMTNDAQADSNGLHPDQHALVFAPNSNGRTFFTGSDGGVVRQSGPFVDHSSDCASRGLSGVQLQDCEQYLSAIPTANDSINTGLQTLQYQSVSVSPRGGVVQAGTQDNGTWQSDAAGGWAETVGGDGGQSAFNVNDPQIRYHSYYAPQHDVSFDGGSPTGWDFIGDPLLDSGEAASFYVPLIADPKIGGTVFDGLQHIWRTTDNGGDQDFLQQYCNELTGDYGHRPQPCGDWVPLGGADGDLSSAVWGQQGADAGNYVVAIERAPSDRSTLWAATRYGRVFISTNANAADPDAVAYTRIDRKLGLPQRFVSGIAIDPANPDHIFISYSGYSAYSPGGHVYEVTWNPATGKGRAKDLSLDLGDQPVTDIVYVPTTRALFASTDFGVLALARGSNSWVATTGLPKVAVYGLTLDKQGNRLYAATHGRSIWRLPVGR